SHTVEPVFGDAKENCGLRRFMRRGLTAANSEANLIFATHHLSLRFNDRHIRRRGSGVIVGALGTDRVGSRG
ncbi:MAG: transposase, partial [Acidimicrobiales bacterium]